MIPKKMIKPPPLSRGDMLGIAAPAGSFDADAFKKGVAVLESMGFRVQIPPGVYEKNGYLAGDDRSRADRLNRLFGDADVKGIVCARGGFGSIRILSLLDYDLIENNPKAFAGFSDISALLWALYSKTGLATFHSPNVTTLGGAPEKTIDAMFSAVSSKFGRGMALENGVEVRPGAARGPLAGGNLTTLCHLAGTPFSPDFGGHILFLEDIGEPRYKIDRALSQMTLAGCFDHISGLALGSFEGCGPAQDIYKLVDEQFGGHDIPIIAGFEAGHGKENITLAFGVEASLDAGEKRLFFP